MAEKRRREREERQRRVIDLAERVMVAVRLILLSWRRGNVTIEITNVKKQYPAAKWRHIVQPIVDSFQFG